MRILLVIDSFFTGGAEFSTLTLFSYLQKNGFKIHICKLKEMNPEYQPDVFGLDSDCISTLPKGGFFQKRKALDNIISDFNPDIVHSVLFKSNLMVRTLSMFDSSFVHIESLVNHTYSEDRFQEAGVSKTKVNLYRLLDKYTAMLGTDHFHANGYSVASHYQEKLRISSKKMTVVHRGREGSTYDVIGYTKSDFAIDENKLVFINVARQEYQKGQDVLLKAMALLPHEVLNRLHLLIVGREGKSTVALQDQISENKLKINVTFLGHRTDIPQLLKTADVFVFPSRFEGLPGVLIEAEAAGLPIICTNLPMMLEVVEADKNALVFDINNEKQLAKAIEKMVLDESIRAQFAIRSKAIFSAHFQIESVHRKMVNLYIKCCQR